MFWTIVIIAAIIFGIIGFVSSDKGAKADGALGGAFMGGLGCFVMLMQLVLYFLAPVLILIWLFS